MSLVKKIFQISFIMIAFILVSCGSGRKVVGLEPGWEVLASRKVNFVRDKDVVPITKREQYTALRFRVEDRDIRISELAIFFSNGDKLQPNIDESINAGQSSKYIELGSQGRYIDRIEFKYRTTGNILKGRANVLVLGRRYDVSRY